MSENFGIFLKFLTFDVCFDCVTIIWWKGNINLLNSYDAVKRLKSLYCTDGVNYIKKDYVIEEALEIYNLVNQKQKNRYVMGAVLKIFGLFEPRRILSIESDIIQLKDLHDTMFALLFKIYDKIMETDKEASKQVLNLIYQSMLNNEQNIDKVITVGQMMKRSMDAAKYQQCINLYEKFDNSNIRFHSNLTNTLFIKACINEKEFDKCEEVIKRKELVNNKKSDIQLLTTLITFYGSWSKIDTSQKILDSIQHGGKNISCINAMMSVFNNHNKYCQSINLYQQYNGNKNFDINCNYITDILFIKACINEKEFIECEKMIDSKKLVFKNKNNIKLLTTLIYFYGQFGKTDKALAIFDLIPEDKRNGYCFVFLFCFFLLQQ